MTDFASLRQPAEVSRIRTALVQLLQAHGVHGSIRLVAHAFNTTFRVRNDEFDLAVRVNVNSNRTLEEVRGELAFVQLVAEAGTVIVPVPSPIFGGSALATVEVAGLPPGRPVCAYTWIEGKSASPKHGKRLGQAMGQAMQRLHAITFPVERLAEGSRPLILNPIDGLPIRWPSESVFDESYTRASEAFARQAAQPARLMHYDLHYGNVKWSAQGLAAFDFDDSVWAWPAADVAQSIYYLRGAGEHQSLERGFWEGLGQTREDLGISESDFEALVAGRALLLLTDLIGNVTREMIDLVPGYLDVTRTRLEHFLRTGSFDPTVATLKR